jgi:hypothetical protein
VLHSDGTETQVPSTMIELSEKTIRITDLDFVLSLSATDQISIAYIPKTVIDRL